MYVISPNPFLLMSMEVDYNPIDLPINSDFKEDSEFKDLDGVDVKDMRLEAEAVVNDVLFAVGNMFVSKNLPCAVDVAYINVEIREGTRYCLELTEAGLRIKSCIQIELLQKFIRLLLELRPLEEDHLPENLELDIAAIQYCLFQTSRRSFALLLIYKMPSLIDRWWAMPLIT
ncbi:GSK3B-interacting protein isoform X3 [Ambystoma mexicanum]|uniref:GSK3B-interacting protein isoform X3 n=1 Tax=Ambystoma mexicanum TaxID=8296 RepID=UPI0037E764EF